MSPIGCAFSGVSNSSCVTFMILASVGLFLPSSSQFRLTGPPLWAQFMLWPFLVYGNITSACVFLTQAPDGGILQLPISDFPREFTIPLASQRSYHVCNEVPVLNFFFLRLNDTPLVIITETMTTKEHTHTHNNKLVHNVMPASEASIQESWYLNHQAHRESRVSLSSL